MLINFYVHKLFGKYNNRVSLDSTNGISLVLGPNGCGKTTMLKMLKSVLSYQHLSLQRYNFEYLELIINENIIRIERTGKAVSDFTQLRLFDDSPNARNISDYENPATLIYLLNGETLDSVDASERKEFSPRRIAELLERELPSEFRRIAPTRFINRETDETYAPERYGELIEKYSDYISSDELKRLFLVIPESIKEILPKIRPKFITTNRLLVEEYVANNYRHEPTSIMAVTSYSNKLQAEMRQILSKYGVESQNLDRQFPMRILKSLKSTNTLDFGDNDDLKKNINDLQSKHIKSGLLEETQSDLEVLDSDIEQLDDSAKIILHQYYEDTLKKLSILNDFSSKINLFLDLINRKLGDSEKQVFISGQNGISVKSNKDIIPLELLSSGEQQQMVLLYDLIFNSDKDQIILIDEPELSLHVTWQRLFIDDIKEIIKEIGIKVIIATHSPQIIGDNWDFVSKLGEVD